MAARKRGAAARDPARTGTADGTKTGGEIHKMTLKLYMHPLSSYCHKVLIAFYENDIPFEAKLLNDAAAAGEFKALWPMARFPLLRDEKRDRLIPESSIIIDYLALHYPGKVKLVPDDPDLAREVRMHDRF